ncbi:hypothetical protein T484DRAFT_1843576 [Baffinella frigidus]|nr:hypothetical protein T484DRAFT_1843576 [Cryptophyta sp. CCMP2293]
MATDKDKAENYFKAGRGLASSDDSLSAVVKKMEGLAVQVAEAPTMDVRDVLEKSFQSVVASIGKKLDLGRGMDGTCSTWKSLQSVVALIGKKLDLGRGVRNLAALLAIDDVAPLYADNFHLESAKPVNFEDLLSHMFHVAKSSTAPEKTLLDVLEITRLSMYLWCPPRSEDSEADPYTEDHVKEDKWDAAGATQACIRVIARRSGGADARLGALKLLATLLHGSSNRARDTMAAFLTEHREICSGARETMAAFLTEHREICSG